MGLLDRKFYVSYLVFGVYVTSIFLLSLLLALVLSLGGVKRSGCDENAFKVVVKNTENDALEEIIKANNVRDKRYVNEKDRDFFDTINKLKAFEYTHPKFQQLKSKFKEIPRCPEIFEYNPVKPLWEYDRLSESILPSYYDLEFYRPYFPQKIYNGEVGIQVNISEDTNTFIVHANMLNVFYPFIYDNQDNSLELKCADYYPLYEYFILRTKENVTVSQGPLNIKLYFNGFLDKFKSGLFLVNYNQGASEFKGQAMVSHFEPLDARKAFPCFDEPSFKAVFKLTVNHPNYTVVASNMPVASQVPNTGRNGTLRTTFEETPRLPPYFLAIAVLNKDEFSYVGGVTPGESQINVWALKNHVDGGFADGPLELALNIYDAVEYYIYPYSNESNAVGPAVINMLALPDYPDDAVAHWGLPIFKETKLLFKNTSVTEQVKQTIALLIGKQFAEFWFGNSVTFKWWNELWLQEGISNYLKYKFVDFAYQDWRINEQFITEELINVLVNDGYPSSHPVIKPLSYFYEIEQLFDDVETAKVAAVMRMIEYEIGDAYLWQSLYAYLKQFEFGTGDPLFLFEQFGNINQNWTAKDFVDRWFLQPNYPTLEVAIKYDSENNLTYLSINQSRFLNTEQSIFGLDSLYPSPFNYVWYIPMKCVFGFTPYDTELEYKKIYVDSKYQIEYLSANYTWVHCDEFFTGYYMLDYTEENWKYLAEILKVKNEYFEAPERSNIIHNIFVNAYTKKERYSDLVNVLSYLREETDYLPWKTVSKHVKDIIDILDYRPSFYAVSTWFNFELRKIEQNIDLWEQTDNHVLQLTKSTILELACRLQDFDCLKNSSSLWNEVSDSIGNPNSNNSVPIHARPVVYNYHFQNTYSIRDWDYTFLQYETTEDAQEEERLLEALTFTRLPSQLARFLESQRSGGLKAVDLIDAVKYFAQNPLGRELVWNYYRANFDDLVKEYSLDSPILGQLLIEITKSFEDEYLFFELIKFIIYTPSGASQNARFKALETVSINIAWLLDKESEIENAFGLGGSTQHKKYNKMMTQKEKFRNRKNSSTSLTGKKFLENLKIYITQLRASLNN